MATNKVELAVGPAITAPGPSPALAVHYQGSGLPPEFQLAGNFGTTSAQAQWSLDGTVWHNVGAPLTADGAVTINRLARFVRWNLTGGTGINVVPTLAY